MKRILLSIITISLVSAVAFGATKAFFTDEEKNTGNTFSAGTIDIAVDGQNPWTRTSPYQFVDMKPSQNEYSNFRINNVGTNPANVFKKVGNVVTGSGAISEPECQEQGGTWSGTQCTSGTEKSDIDTVIDYDLSVKVYDAGNNLKWWQMLYNKDVTLASIKNTDMFLGMIPVGWYMDVTESYHMNDNTTNWAQGDLMTFDIVLTGEQLKGTLVLENKTGDPDWDIIQGDSKQGTLTYGVKDSKFNYSFAATGMQVGVKYWLIEYRDPWGTAGTTLGSATADAGGNVVIPSTSLELNANLTNAKIWLVTDVDYDEANNKVTGWNPANYLFETGLMDYYDADL